MPRSAPSKERTAPNGGGRVATCEILMVNPAVANLIATAKSNQIYSAMETGAAQGMQTLEQDLARLWVANLISEHAAVDFGPQPAGAARPRGFAAAAPAAAAAGGAR